jgi:hypothetical protein
MAHSTVENKGSFKAAALALLGAFFAPAAVHAAREYLSASGAASAPAGQQRDVWEELQVRVSAAVGNQRGEIEEARKRLAQIGVRASLVTRGLQQDDAGVIRNVTERFRPLALGTIIINSATRPDILQKENFDKLEATTLIISDWPHAESDLANVAKIKHLHKLTIRGGAISGEVLGYFAASSSGIREMKLECSEQFDFSHVRTLGSPSFSMLQWLYIAAPQFDTETFAKFPNINSLVKLNLRDTAVSPQTVVERLAEDRDFLPRLQELVLPYAEIPADAWSRINLNDTRPGLIVVGVQLQESSAPLPRTP